LAHCEVWGISGLSQSYLLGGSSDAACRSECYRNSLFVCACGRKRPSAGRGVTTLPNGDTYDGSYVNGRRNGRGLYRFVPAYDIAARRPMSYPCASRLQPTRDDPESWHPARIFNPEIQGLSVAKSRHFGVEKQA